MASNKQIILAKRPQGKASTDCFETVDKPVPSIKDGEVLVKITYISVDPYLRGRMDDKKSYTKPQDLGQVMVAGSVGEVVESKNSNFPVGTHVQGYLGWQHFAVSNGEGLNIIDTSKIAPSAYLGVVGMPGVTAWHGLHKILKPKAGETVLVSAASGAVGSVVGQLAKHLGCHVVGIAGGPDKCEYVVKELGFDACIDYKKYKGGDVIGQVAKAIREAAPKGVDCYFENVGGDIGNAAFQCMNAHGRIAYCGVISAYDGTGSFALEQAPLILINRLFVQGFIVSEHPESFPPGKQELAELVVAGKLKYKETVLEGLDKAPEGLLGLLQVGDVVETLKLDVL